ncbi:hypothetical protein MNB_SV-6-1739 [hydrothermal vent metagenome]|uniref:FUSC family protein n=1 Tax=hydrothermal vent metagenome TaxID=652676 RepID=A0A1W1BYD3_9ZZZZ
MTSLSKLSIVLNQLLAIHISQKAKYAIKSALSLALVYLISFYQGWSNISTAAITVMIIAINGPVYESVTKGIYRVIGTIIGAIIGIALIAIFPQERAIYLIVLSIFATFILYLARAYRGDYTIFMLSVVTMMGMFQNGKVDNLLIMAIDKTLMTIFGIVIYSIVAIFIWPVRSKNNTVELAKSLLAMQKNLFLKGDASYEQKEELIKEIESQESLLQRSTTLASIENSGLTKAQRDTIFQTLKQVNIELILFAYTQSKESLERQRSCVKNIDIAYREIEELFDSIDSAIESSKTIKIPKKFKADFDIESLEALSHFERATLSSKIYIIQKLHEQLRIVANQFNSIISPYPTNFKLNKTTISSFNWFDIEDIKGSIVTFLVFWSATFFWIYFNPPGGFYIVSMSVVFSLITAFTPIKPSILIIIYTISFVIATLAYLFILPNIYHTWAIMLFIFAYSFIAFYLIDAQITIFFLMGLIIMNISNVMYYDFSIYLSMLMMFYIFLSILLFFYYIPFSTKPEVLFLSLKDRFCNLSFAIIKKSDSYITNRSSLFLKLKALYGEKHLSSLSKKMKLWGESIDLKYFDSIQKEKLDIFLKSCEEFAYMLLLMQSFQKSISNNRLIEGFCKRYQNCINIEAFDINNKEELEDILKKLENDLEEFFTNMKDEVMANREEVIDFYLFFEIRKNLLTLFLRIRTSLSREDFQTLQKYRF